MIIHCIRHTKVDVASGICYGQTDVGLISSYPNEKDAVLIGLQSLSYDQVYSSPLSRCKTLAEDLFPNKKLIFDKRLKELNFGKWEMQHWDDISNTTEAKSWFADFVHIKCPDGESFIDQINRTQYFLLELKKTNFSSVVLVVHGGIIRAINCIINKIDPLDAFKTKVDYGEIKSFELK